MSTHKLHIEHFEIYFCTITCYKWLPLFEIVDFYDAIYQWFNHLKKQNAHVLGYVIMPNHIHVLLFNANPKRTINRLIGEGKRFMAYDIVAKLKQNKNQKVLKILKEGVQKNERMKGKKHQVFRLSFDAKECFDESMIEQKLDYIHRNPVSGKWNLENDFVDYIHSSASFYELDEEGVYKVLHYKKITSEFKESVFQNTQLKNNTTPSESPVRDSEVDNKEITSEFEETNFTNETQSPLRETLREKRSKPFVAPTTFIEAWQSGKQEFTIHTSGSTGRPKAITISRTQMLASIENTQKAFNLKKGDTALVCINTSYIGGMMMLARSLKIGMDMTIVKPSANPFLEIDTDKKFEFIALVPMQLEAILDSIHAHRLNDCKAIIIGGAAVNDQLLEKLQEVTAPIYATYGMTETVSHIALKRVNGQEREDVFTAFENVDLGVDDRGCLVIEGAITKHKKVTTNDKVKLLNNKQFNLLGRIDHVINSGGVKIQIEQLESKLAAIFKENSLFQTFFITSKTDAKLGEKVVLCIESSKALDTDEILNLLKPNLDRFEVPKEIISLSQFERTETGKVKRVLP